MRHGSSGARSVVRTGLGGATYTAQRKGADRMLIARSRLVLRQYARRHRQTRVKKSKRLLPFRELGAALWRCGGADRSGVAGTVGEVDEMAVVAGGSVGRLPRRTDG